MRPIPLQVFLLIFVAIAITIASYPLSIISQTSSQSFAPASSTGILLLAHGGGKEWNANVDAIAAEVNKTEPAEVAFGMADRTTLQAGIDKLTARGVKQIVAVPLFVSSHSSVIEATRYLLGLRADAPPELMDFAMEHGHGDAAKTPADKPAQDKASQEAQKTKPVSSIIPIRMSAALDRHRILAEILTDRAAAISVNPGRETIVLVAHGPNDDKENALWIDDLNAVAKQIAGKRPFARIEVTTLRDDADAPVRDQATQQLRSFVSAGNEQNYRVLIVPVLLSYGGIENGIRTRLDGLNHVMSPAGLLPDQRIPGWVIEASREASHPNQASAVYGADLDAN